MIKGQCLCGAVTIAATPVRGKLTACHCDMCRRWCSGPFVAFEAASEGLKIDGPFVTRQTSDWAERANCAQCSSPLWYRMTDPAGSYNLAAGLFDTGAMPLGLEVWIDHKPDGYAFQGAQKQMTEAECLAFFAPPEQGETP